MLPKQGKLLSYDRLQPYLGNKNGKAKDGISNKTLANLGFQDNKYMHLHGDESGIVD